MEADRLKISYGPNGSAPACLQDLNARGIRVIETHVAESHKMIAKKDYAKAEANLTAGAQIAASLGLFAKPVEEARAQLRTASAGKFGGPAAAAPTPARPDPAVASAPIKPIAGTSTPGAKTVVQASGGLSARQLLDQAYFEFKRSDLDMATKLAQQAHKPRGTGPTAS